MTQTKINTYFEGRWHGADAPIMSAADHGAWLGTTVFDGARYFNGVAPDLAAHCARVNASASALMLNPFMDPDEMFAHGLNERVPIKAFYDALDHWSVIMYRLAGSGASTP